MHIKQLSTEEVTHVFNNSMQFDFPQNEIRPLSSIKIKAYALFCHAPFGKCLLLDYYAVNRADRNKGYGSMFLKKLQEILGNFSGIILKRSRKVGAGKKNIFL